LLIQRWCIPPEQDAEFCWRMEDVLGVYTRPYDPHRPQVCLDETSRQLLGEVNPPMPPAPGRPARQDYEYQRGGVCNLFLVTEPLAGWRHVTCSDRRTRVDWAHCIRDLVDVHYPDAERIVLVQDNLNTHTPASLYEAFAPAEARRLADRLELHYTPKHGSWLNMAEIELAMLAGQCLDRRLADRTILEREVAAWQAARNRAGRGVNWRFTTEDARIKLKHLYPTTHDSRATSALPGRGVCSSPRRTVLALVALLPAVHRELLAVLAICQPGNDRIEDRQGRQPDGGFVAEPVDLVDDEDP
jgi:hypothetical protein